MDAQNPTPQEVTAQLKSAHGSRMAKVGFTVAGYGLITLGIFSALFALGLGWLLDAGMLGYGVMGGLTVLPMVLSVLMFTGARRAAQRSAEALEQAWSGAVTALYRARGGSLSADDLARATGLTPEEATLRLAEAEVSAFLDPQFAPSPKLRVESTSDAQLEAEAEQELREALGEAQTETFKARS